MTTPATMRVVTWNLWWKFGPWEERQRGIVETLRAADADIIGLQETWSDQVAQLADALGMVAAYSGHKEHDFGNAVLSRWPIASQERLTLPEGGGRAFRSAMYAAIDAPFGRVPVFSTHFAHRFDRSAVRVEQAGALAQFVAERRGDPDKAYPPVVLGDLNAVPQSDEVRQLVGLSAPPVEGLVFSDAWDQVGEGPGFTWSPDNPHQVDSAWPHRRLDYVLVGWPRPRPAGNPHHIRLLGTMPVDGLVPSDHFAVCADLRLPAD